MRTLLSLTVNLFPVPTAGSEPIGITTGPDGNLWVAEAASNNIGRINPTTHKITEFPIPTANSRPLQITAGPDGNLWFTEGNAVKIGEINPTTHAITDFPVPTSTSSPTGITAGPDGNLWFTEATGNKIGQINPTTHAIAEFPIPTINSRAEGIVAGPDGNLWFTEFNKIGQINPTTHAITEFPIPTAASGAARITAGPDGNLWFTENLADQVGEINPTTHVITEFHTPTAGAVLVGITAGPDGNLWFVEDGAVAQINPTTHVITEFPVLTPGTTPLEITSGPDGNLWLTEEEGNNIGQVVLKAPPKVPDLALTGAGPASVFVGSDVTYTFTVTNDGASGATGVKLTDTLPAGVTFISATGGVTPVGGVLDFAIGNLAVGATTSVDVVVAPNAAGTLINQASVSANETDPTPADNSATQTTIVAAVAASADLALSGSAPGSVTLGNNVTYSLTVTNGGPSDATGVTLTDTLPAGASFVSATGGVTPVGGVLTFPLGKLSAETSTTATVVVAPTAAGTLINQASVSGNETDPTPADNSATQTTIVAAVAASADLALSGSAPGSVTLGNNVKYSLTVTNGGPSDATGVTLTDSLPAGVSFVSATGGVTPVSGVLTFALGNLAAETSTTVTIVVAPNAAGTLINQASVKGDQSDPTPTDNNATQATTVATPVGVDGPTVTLVQRFGFHARPTTLVLTFDKLLDPVRAQNVGNYQIVALGGSRRPIAIRSAAYDSTTSTVTLFPAQRLNVHNRFRLTVVGIGSGGVTDTFGNLLDGQKTGHPGSNFVAIVTEANLVLPANGAGIKGLRQTLASPSASHVGSAVSNHFHGLMNRPLIRWQRVVHR
ncbi:MAG TPA: hypothetical protein VGZ22_00965 [Isosphaeraceae bacterium]|nr:hypothetical protein [Isosphaeraceae bacterium]